MYARITSFAVVAAVAFAGVQPVPGGDWPAWRGPSGNGVAESSGTPPVEWSENENVIWKSTVPGRGHASPTICSDRIYLSTADEQNEVQGIVAFNRDSGKREWITKLSSGGFPKTHPKNTHATSTVACDGERLFVTFHHHRKLTLHAVNIDGETLWSKTVGQFHPQRYEYGYAASPLIYADTVIVAADVEHGGYLAAFNRRSGDLVWQQDRPKLYSFSSPVVAHLAGRDQLLISGCERVSAYDPNTGRPLWSVKGTTMATCGTMVWDGDLVFASGGYPDAETLGVKADGSNEVIWRNRQKCYEQSMLAHDGHVYAVTDQGIAFCWRARDGKEMWKERLAGPVSASPVLAGDLIYSTNEKGTTFIFRADPREFELVATNKLGEEGFATLSIVDGRIYLRTATGSRGQRQEFLYCLGNQ